MRPLLQSRWVWAAGLLGLTWHFLLDSFLVYVDHPRRGVESPVVRDTAIKAVLVWMTAVAGMLTMHPVEWAVASVRRFIARLTWGLGWLLTAVHVLTALGVAHGWSHADAVRHTENVSGVGAGVFVNYLFVAVWAADVAWFAAFPRHYVERPRWVGRAVHGFLAFVTFNATVVYNPTDTRWVWLALFACLGWLLLRRGTSTRQSPPVAT